MTMLVTAYAPLAKAGTGAITYDTDFVRKFGSAGTGNGQFSTAESIVRGPDDRLYVADRFNHRVQVFDLQGNYITQFGSFGGGLGQLNEPTMVTFDPDGNIAVSSLHTGTVNIYDKDTYAPIRNIGGLAGPHGIVNVGSNMYIVELLNGRVNIMDTAGNSLGTVGTPNLSFPHFMTQTSDGKFYITEYFLGEVKVFDSNFNFLGAETIGAGVLNKPVGIYKDGHDNLFVVDSDNDRIVVFDKNGNILHTYGTRGSGDGQFYGARGIYVGADGQLYVTEGYNFTENQALNNRVQEFLFKSTETFNASPGAGDQNATTDYAIVQLTGTGSFADDFIGYDDLLVNGDWSLSGTHNFSNSVILNSGELTIANGGSITAPDVLMASGSSLIVNGSLTSAQDLQVSNGALLGGNGSINTDTVVATGGTVAPGSNGIGTLTVNGNYTQNAGSVYRIDVNAAGQSDRLVVNGNVFLDGTLNVQAIAGNYGFSTPYTILTSTGTVTGNYATILNNLVFLDANVTYNANNVQLTLTQNGAVFSDFADTPNQKSTARALDQMLANGGSDSATVGNALSTLTTQQVNQAIDQIAPDEIASLNAMRGRFTGYLNNLIDRRLHTLAMQNDPRLYGARAIDDLGNIAPAAGLTALDDPALKQRNVWFQGTGAVTQQKSDFNAAGALAKTMIFRGGIDKDISQSLLVGLAPGYIRSDIDFDNEKDEARIDYYRLDAYAAYTQEAWDFNLMGGFGLGKQKSKRSITAGGLDRVAEGDATYKDVSVQGEAGYTLHLPNQAYVRPAMKVTAGYTWQDGFTEEGAGSLNLRYDDNSDAYVQFNPNATLGQLVLLRDKETIFNPYIGGGVVLRPGNDRERQVAAFSNMPAASDAAFGVDAPRNAKLSFELNGGFNLYNPEKETAPALQMHYRGLISDTTYDHAVTATVTWRF